MTKADVAERIEAIRKAAEGDHDATAHIMEDQLHRDVLKAIADGSPAAAEIAGEALKTAEIEFSHWYE